VKFCAITVDSSSNYPSSAKPHASKGNEYNESMVIKAHLPPTSNHKGTTFQGHIYMGGPVISRNVFPMTSS